MISLVTALCICTLGQEGKVTFSEPAARAELLIPKLAKAIGRKINVAPAQANEVIHLSVREMPVADRKSVV